MKKMFRTLGIMAVLMALFFTSCQQDRSDDQLTGGNGSVSISDLKTHLAPAAAALPEEVKNQIEASKANLVKFTGGNLQIEGYEVLGTLNSAEGVSMAKKLLADTNNTVTSGNLMDMNTFKVGKLANLGNTQDVADAKADVTAIADSLVTSGLQVMEIKWTYGNTKFNSVCIYNEKGIVYDTAITGIVIMDATPVEATSDDMLSKASWRWVSSTWTANWLWGSKRGEMGYKITIYYTKGKVSNVDRSDWAHITLGKAKSESKTLVGSGSYGKIQYALGLCTPVGSLGFDYKNFKVSFSGLGSNIVANGTRSLYP